MDNFAGTGSNYNWYDLYRPNYNILLEDHERIGTVVIDGEERTYKRGYTMAEYTPWIRHLTNKKSVMGDYVTTYMNQEELRTALNIPPTVQTWDMCRGEPDFYYHYQNEASMWIYSIL
jgi:excinuclease UvrABC nuclease subunit